MRGAPSGGGCFVDDDELTDDRRRELGLHVYSEASDAEICKWADSEDMEAEEILMSWPLERRLAAIRAVDKEWAAQWN